MKKPTLNYQRHRFPSEIISHAVWAVRDGDVGTAPVPDPSTILLLGSGLVGLIGYGMRKAQA